MTQEELDERCQIPKQSDLVQRFDPPLTEEMLDGQMKGLVEAIPPYRIIATELNVDPKVVISETVIGFAPTSREATNFMWYFAGWLAGTISSHLALNKGVTWTMELLEEGAQSDYIAVKDHTKRIEVVALEVGEDDFRSNAHYNWDWEDSSEKMQGLFNELFFALRR